MRIFNIIFCVIFIVFAALQYNDPDPYLWIPIYLYAALMCWLIFRNKRYPVIILSGILVFSIYALYKVFDSNGLLDWINKHNAENIAETMKAEKPWIEESREFFGLLIVIIVLLTDYIYIKRKKQHTWYVICALICALMRIRGTYPHFFYLIYLKAIKFIFTIILPY